MFIHIFVCLLLIVIVLLQSGKSADLAGAFGGMGSQSTFGPRGRASLLSKMTTTLAILFMVTSLSLWIIAANKSGSQSILSKEDGMKKPTQTAPAKKTGPIPPVEQKQEKAATVTPTEKPATPSAAEPGKAKADETPKAETPVKKPTGQN